MIPRHVILILFLCSLSSCEKAVELVRKWSPSSASSSSGEARVVTGNLAAQPAMVAAAGPVVTNLGANHYESFIRTPGRLMVVEFRADWCGACRSLDPVLYKVAGEFGGAVNVGRIDVDRSADLAARQGVSAIPDVRLYRDGVEVGRFLGGDADKLRGLFKSHVAVPQAADGGTGGDAVAGAPTKAVMERMSADWMPAGMRRR